MPRTSKRNQPQPAATAATATTEAAGPAFQRLIVELAAERELGTQHAAEAAAFDAQAAELRAELARLEARQARAGKAAVASQQRCGDLGREMEQLGPRLGYNFNLPQDASLAIIGQLGVARCRAARACRRLRAAVGSAHDLGAFRHRVLAVCAGGYDVLGHTVVCTGDAVFSFGCGREGQLGYAAEAQATPRAVTGPLDQEVVAAAASASSTLVCTAQGQAYWFGTLDGEHRVDGEFSILTSSLPTLVGELQEVVGVAAGRNHLLAWTQSGQLYTWGDGEYGKLGHGSEDDEAAPRLVEGLAGQQVVGGDGGHGHSVVCTASGRLYTFGSGIEQLGHGEDAADEQFTPKLVETLVGSMVVAVGAGSLFGVAVTEVGELYTWGCCDASGHGEEIDEDVYLPRLVAGLAGKRVAGLSSADYHTLVWTDSGELYSWGDGEYGQLGHNSTGNECSLRRVEALVGKVVVGAAAGFVHSVVVTREQKVYCFGANSSGQLGQGSELEDAPVVVDFEQVPKEVGGLRTSAK